MILDVYWPTYDRHLLGNHKGREPSKEEGGRLAEAAIDPKIWITSPRRPCDPRA